LAQGRLRFDSTPKHHEDEKMVSASHDANGSATPAEEQIGRTSAGTMDRPAKLPRQLAAFGFDIGAPIAAYYLLHAFGISNLVALGVGAIFPALSVGYGLATKRRIDTVSVLVLGTLAVTVLATIVSRDPRFLLAKDGLITGLWGVWFLASVWAHRPAAFLFARPFMEGRRAFAVRDWDLLWQCEPRFRRLWRVSSVIWGIGMLGDAVVRVVMAYTLPIRIVPGLSGALWPVTFVLLQIVTNIYYAVAGLNQMLGARWPDHGVRRRRSHTTDLPEPPREQHGTTRSSDRTG
jgi:hypothetical protein